MAHKFILYIASPEHLVIRNGLPWPNENLGFSPNVSQMKTTLDDIVAIQEFPIPGSFQCHMLHAEHGWVLAYGNSSSLKAWIEKTWGASLP